MKHVFRRLWVKAAAATNNSLFHWWMITYENMGSNRAKFWNKNYIYFILYLNVFPRWPNNISFPSNRGVIRCFLSNWQNDEFPHRILHWHVNVFNCSLFWDWDIMGKVWQLGNCYFLLLMQPCQISLTFKPSAKGRKKKQCDFFFFLYQSHINASTACAGLKICYDFTNFCKWDTENSSVILCWNLCHLNYWKKIIIT